MLFFMSRSALGGAQDEIIRDGRVQNKGILDERVGNRSSTYRDFDLKFV